MKTPVIFFLLALSISEQISAQYSFIEQPAIDKGFVPDGKFYNPKSTDIGPISPEIMKAHRALAYLGAFNGKFFYIDRTLAKQLDARDRCAGFGMKLVSFDTQAELNFITSVTSSADDHAWSDGRVDANLGRNFLWPTRSGTYLNSTLQAEFWELLGLTISRNETTTKLCTELTINWHYYICNI